MKVYYREGDEVFYGDLMYITETCETPVISFDTKGLRRKIVSIKNPEIVAIGMSRIHVRDDNGTDYMFYTDRPDWVLMVPAIADWARVKQPSAQIEEEFDVLDFLLTSDKKEV